LFGEGCLMFSKITFSLFIAMSSLLILEIFALNTNYVAAEPNFGAAGDWGCSSNTKATVSNIRSHSSPERVFGIGDYSYTSTPTCWLDIIDAIKSRTRIAIGNHEDDSSEGFSSYMSAFGLSKTYYAFTYGNVRVIVMDTDHDSYSKGSSQYNFVISELSKASTDSTIKFIIVYMHKQMYTSPNTCSSSSCSNTGSDATNLRNIYHSQFGKYGVDLVLNGHVHNFQRTFPIKYDSGSPSSPIVTSSASTDYYDPYGQVFAVVGTGGVNIHALSGKASWVKYQQDSRFGALDINIENSGNTLAGRYYTNDGTNRDTFTISKGSTSFSGGTSLTLAGESAGTQTTASVDAKSNEITVTQSGQPTVTQPGQPTDTQSGQPSGTQPVQPDGQGKGLDCEHFKNQGPERCRTD
jgi:calcineurin-like phosphoesterase family protein